MSELEVKDFFVSYHATDKNWAEWLAWILEEAGHGVVIQAWDFLPGGNFGLEMHKAADQTRVTLVVLSQDYLDGAYTKPEWAAAFVYDPQADKRQIIPFRVSKCKPGGLLKAIIYVDLVSLSEAEARQAVLGAFNSRGKPDRKPQYPGVAFPGIPTSSRDPQIGANPPAIGQSARAHILAPQEMVILLDDLSHLKPQVFNMLVSCLNPPLDLIPPMPARDLVRATAMLEWVLSPTGPGLPKLTETLDRLLSRRHLHDDDQSVPQTAEDKASDPVRAALSVSEPDDGSRALLIKAFIVLAVCFLVTACVSVALQGNFTQIITVIIIVSLLFIFVALLAIPFRGRDSLLAREQIQRAQQIAVRPIV